ncbi:DUF3823 domain-containing protein, partial [Parabacteroides sp. OttesenSCG-928-G06]|nr:DUF3823 domain-containing protein [Parabacteroides sp. OttesenSCG-928-G06]
MKKFIQYSLLLAAMMFFVTACDVDNYDEPNASITGIVIDKTTGEGLNTEQPNGFRIKWIERSWGDNVQPDYFYGMEDGKFNWDWVFGYSDSQYEIQPVEGAFVTPEAQVVTIKKGERKELQFEVIPYIHIESDYQLNGKELTVRFTATRPAGSTPTYDINQVWVLVSNKTRYISYRNTGGYISDISQQITFDESNLGQQITATITLKESGTHYFRVMVQTKNPSNACNYTKIETIQV